MSRLIVPPRRRVSRALLLASGLLLLLPAVALAHPLGNFTVNHYAGIKVEPSRILVDLVIDEAEIPTFQDRLRIDTNGDGVISDVESNVERIAACPRLVPYLDATVDGMRLEPVVFAAGLSFPPGTAGLSTMRLVCEFALALPATTRWPISVGFADASHPGRIGWHEVVVSGSGVTLDRGNLPTTSISNRLRTYPPNLIPHPLDVQNVSFSATLGGPTTPDVLPADAESLSATAAEAAGETPDPSTPASPGPGPTGSDAVASPPQGVIGAVPPAAPSAGPTGTSTAAGAVPGGVLGIDIGGLVDSDDLTPLVLLGALVAAFLLGAGHALTPGHGKTVTGAYLVGSRGTALHAIALGLAVTVSHTLGIVVLAAVILRARDVAPELFNSVAPVVSGLAVVAIGAWLLVGQLRRRGQRHAEAAHVHPHTGHTHDGHDHAHTAGIDVEHDPAGPAIGWRSLFALGLAGGLIPSTNALIILLAAINANRPAYGLVLVVAFGLGMACVLTGVGLVLVLARDRVDHLPAALSPGRLAAYLPIGAACLILVLGFWLTGQAIAAGPTF